MIYFPFMSSQSHSAEAIAASEEQSLQTHMLKEVNALWSK